MTFSSFSGMNDNPPDDLDRVAAMNPSYGLGSRRTQRENKDSVPSISREESILSRLEGTPEKWETMICVQAEPGDDKHFGLRR